MRRGGRNKITKINRRNDRARRRRDQKRGEAAAARTLRTIYDSKKGIGSLPPNLRAEMEKQRAEEVGLYRLDYYAECETCANTKRTSRATTIARGYDATGRPLGIMELCDAHAEGLKSKRKVIDHRGI